MVVYIGVPSKPKGPLQVEDICADGCTLKWNKPEDDGGKPVDHYLIERMDTESGRWVPVATSKGTEADVSRLPCLQFLTVKVEKYQTKAFSFFHVQQFLISVSN